MKLNIRHRPAPKGEVFAIQIGKEYFHVPNRRRGAYFSAEQCEECGAAIYRVIDGRTAVCVGDSIRPGGCGTRYAIVLLPEDNVIFP